ncbi:MAG TPA: MurR/RpiR family transcriptional regulator [Thermodesulfobacteriota bacterium]
MNLLERIERRRAALTESERELAAFVVEHYPHMAFESATSIGQRVGVSAATVVRFFAKLGYEGFADVQRELRAEVAARLHSPIERLDAAREAPDEASELLRQSLTVDLGNLEATYRGVDPEQFRLLVERLVAPGGRIYVMGEKKGYGVAHYLHTQLNLALPDVTLLESGQSLLVDRLLRLTEKDLLVAIDVRRYARATVLVARRFRDIGADVAVLADSPLSPLSGLARFRLPITTTGAGAFDSYTAAVSLVNAIVNGVAIRRKQALHDTLERGEALWQEFQTFTARDFFEEGYPTPPGGGEARRG